MLIFVCYRFLTQNKMYTARCLSAIDPIPVWAVVTFQESLKCTLTKRLTDMFMTDMFTTDMFMWSFGSITNRTANTGHWMYSIHCHFRIENGCIYDSFWSYRHSWHFWIKVSTGLYSIQCVTFYLSVFCRNQLTSWWWGKVLNEEELKSVRWIRRI